VNEIEFIYQLAADLQDRLRVRATKNRWRIVSFVFSTRHLFNVGGELLSVMILPIDLLIGMSCTLMVR